jgi:anti-sigma regulatory factor (Ser/Thr protein kinase)
MPVVPSYDVCATFEPADLTGGDTYDLALLDERLLIVLGDATGHGIAPALSVTQMQAMLRMAFRLGADLETAFMQVNNRLAETLADDRFITAFIGILDPATHVLRFHSGGQGPIFHYRAADDTWDRYKPTSFPLGAMALAAMRPPLTLELQPGDVLAVISDGIFEFENGHGEAFGEVRTQALIAANANESTTLILERLRAAVRTFAGDAPQEDDMTAVLVKRQDPLWARASFERTFDVIESMAAFSAAAFARLGADEHLLPIVDLAVEELFTNMVKYGVGSSAPVRLEMGAIAGGVEVRLTDVDVEPFDITQAPDVDVNAPIEEREPGGLGLHLIRRMADSVEYEYEKERRQSRITLRFTSAGLSARR